MKKLFPILFVALFLFIFELQAQVGKSVGVIKIFDPNDNPKVIPHVGEKVLMILYTDPDEKDINDQLSNAVKAKNYPKDKYAGVGIANCKETWIPNSAIRMKARQKEKQYPGSIIMIDTDRTLAKTLGLSDCDDMGVVIIIGKDKVVKYVKYVKSESESKAIIGEVTKMLDEEIAK